MSNHPVQFVDKDNNLSPSTFIPFCQFGFVNTSHKHLNSLFDMPVCTCFRPKLHHRQLCYEVDLNNHTRKESKLAAMKVGLMFLMDYNEDRQLVVEEEKKDDTSNERYDLSERFFFSEKSATIYIDAIGKLLN